MPSFTYAPASLAVSGGDIGMAPVRFDYAAASLTVTGGSLVVGPDFSSSLTAGSLNLNRIPRGVPLVESNGAANEFLQLLYQRNCEGTEAAFQQLADQVGLLSTIVSGLQAAQDAAAQANQGVATLNAGVSLSSSRTNPVDGLLTATSDGVITVSAHQRVYTTGSTETSVAVNAGSVSGFAQGAFVRVYYNDAARAGGAVAYLGTTDEITQVGDTHVIGGIAIPTAGSPPASGTGTTPPGYVREQVVGTGGAQA